MKKDVPDRHIPSLFTIVWLFLPLISELVWFVVDLGKGISMGYA